MGLMCHRRPRWLTRFAWCLTVSSFRARDLSNRQRMRRPGRPLIPRARPNRGYYRTTSHDRIAPCITSTPIRLSVCPSFISRAAAKFMEMRVDRTSVCCLSGCARCHRMEQSTPRKQHNSISSILKDILQNKTQFNKTNKR